MMIAGECFTLTDDLTGDWPKVFATVPQPGWPIQSKGGGIRAVVRVLHTFQYDSLMCQYPYLLVELGERRDYAPDNHKFDESAG